MKSYFTRLFDYDHFENAAIIKIILAADNPQKATQLMAHTFAAQQRWLSRFKGEDIEGNALWPDWRAESLEQINNDNYQAWKNYLDTLNDGDLDNIISYKNSVGIAYSNSMVDILAHVINHGTHHRAQAGLLLKLAGAEKLPVTDYIFYVREYPNL